jgi:acetyltransferase-like isoleucine patch superfamily enzyme
VTDHYDLQCGIEIGRNCHFNFGCYLSGTGGLTIGDNCLFAPDVKVITGGHNFDDVTRPIIEQGINRGRVFIEDNVWIGAGAIILPNVRIGSGSVVAAGAVVTKSVEPNSVVGGVPATLLRVRGQKESVIYR